MKHSRKFQHPVVNTAITVNGVRFSKNYFTIFHNRMVGVFDNFYSLCCINFYVAKELFDVQNALICLDDHHSIH